MVLLSWLRAISKVHPAQFTWWMQTLRQMAANPQIKPNNLGGLKSPSRLLPSTSAIDNLLLLSLIADTHFTSRGGWKAESAYALKYRCAARTQHCISRGFHDKHNRPQWDLEPGSSHTAVKCTSHYLFCVRDVQEAVHESVNAQNLTGVKDAFATCFGR